MEKYYLLGLGSNIEPKRHYIQTAITKLESLGTVLDRARLYATEPLGPADQNFLNTAILLRSELEPEPLMDELLKIELSLGRTREVKWGNRTIDLDIILGMCKNLPITCDSSKATIPHPEAMNRLFVLEPANDIAPDWPIPGTDYRIATMLKKWGSKNPTYQTDFISLEQEDSTPCP